MKSWEQIRELHNARKIRIVRGFTAEIWDGHFKIPRTLRRPVLFCIASDGSGWDHVSVSVPLGLRRTPTWEELEVVRKMVTLPDEVWVQYHVPAEQHVNNHPFVLHLWRPQNETLPQPPAAMV